GESGGKLPVVNVAAQPIGSRQREGGALAPLYIADRETCVVGVYAMQRAGTTGIITSAARHRFRRPRGYERALAVVELPCEMPQRHPASGSLHAFDVPEPASC